MNMNRRSFLKGLALVTGAGALRRLPKAQAQELPGTGFARFHDAALKKPIITVRDATPLGLPFVPLASTLVEIPDEGDGLPVGYVLEDVTVGDPATVVIYYPTLGIVEK